MKQVLQNISFLVLIGLMVSSCNRSLFGNHPERMVLPGPTAVVYPCILSKDSDNVGCGEIALERIKDIKESTTAVNPVLQFEQQFGSVFYNDFFEILLVEPDLRKKFASESSIADVSPKENSNVELMKDCSACNAVATVFWKKKSFYYPYTASEDVMNVLNDSYKLKGKTSELSFVIYQNKNGENIKVSMTSNKGTVRSYKLVKGTKDQLLASMRAFKFPKKDRIKPS